MTTTNPRTDGGTAATVSVAAAIAVFGLIYGAAAEPVLGAPLTVLSSVLIFSGAAQFSMIALLGAGATPLAVLAAIAPLAVRHLPLGAVLRPHLTASRRRRALLAWFLIDETTGVALTRPGHVVATLTRVGGAAYAAWVLGTVAGVVGAALPGIESLADAVFPVLFVGLAAVTATRADDVIRALLAGGAALVLLLSWPGAGVLGAIAVAVVVAVPATPSRSRRVTR